MIPIYFSVDLYQEGKKDPDSTYTFYHALQYSPIGDDFTIFFSERNETVPSLNLEQAKELLPRIVNYPTTSSGKIDDNKNYYISVTAWLDKIQFEGMGEELNLLYYWNSIKPNNKTVQFSKSDFQV
jgi:hypothetical protein